MVPPVAPPRCGPRAPGRGVGRLRSVVLGFIALAGLAALLPGCGARLTLPVAVTSVTVTDSSRSTPARGATPAHPGRTLPTTIYYPSSGPAPYPLVVFAHGFNVTPAYYDVLLRSLASAGYVVAAPEFPISSPNGSGPARRDDIPNQPGDLSAVITYMTGSWPQRDLLIPDLVGAMGHSDGGITVAGMAMVDRLQDSRVHTFAVLSGAIPSGVGNIVPNPAALLVMNGTDDSLNSPLSTIDPADPTGQLRVAGGTEPGTGAGVRFPTFAQSMYDLAAPPKAYTKALNGGHATPFIGSGTQPDAVRATLVDFLNIFLRGDGNAVSWFQSDGNWAPYTSTVSWGVG